MMGPMSTKPSRTKPRAHLDFWLIVRTSNSSHLVGFVFGHVRLPDGHLIVTSDVVRMHLVSGWLHGFETVNTNYSLGRPRHPQLDADYRELLDEILGEDEWQVARLEDLPSLRSRC